MGEPDVDAMLGRLTAPQFGRWMAFYIADVEAQKEEHEQDALEREALSGGAEIRNRLS